MSAPHGAPFSQRVLRAVGVVIAVAVGARVAWELLAPMLGVLIVAAALIGVYLIALRRFRGG